MRKNKGFTLIEVMMALTVFAVGVLAVGKMQLTSIDGNNEASLSAEALISAQSKLEELMSKPFTTTVTDPDLVDTNGDQNAGLNAQTATSADFVDNTSSATFTYLWNIDDLLVGGVAGDPDNAKQIRLFVQWDSKWGMRQIVLNALKMQ